MSSSREFFLVRPLLQYQPRHANKPFVSTGVQFYQFRIGHFIKVDRLERFVPCSMGDFKNAARGSMNSIVFVTFSNVRPIEDVNPTIRSVTQFHPAKPWVGEFEEIGIVSRGVSCSLALDRVLIQAAPVIIDGEYFVAILRRPI